MIPKRIITKDKQYLAWCRRQGGLCCICKAADAVDLHHWGESGMGTKGDDRYIARLCRACHEAVQGKGWISCARGDMDWEQWARMIFDGFELRERYRNEI